MAVSIARFERVFVALVIQHAMRMHHIVICGLFGSYSIFTNLTNGTIFGLGVGWGAVTENKAWFDFLYDVSYSEKDLASYDSECILVFM